MNFKTAIWTILVAVGLFLVGSQPVEAAEVWTAQYWNNTTRFGEPTYTRLESGLNNSWGFGSPHESIGNDNFSAKYETKTEFSAGLYRFFATSDDGMRVYVDNELIIDVWYESQEHITNADVYMSGGFHALRVEYFEASGQATAKLRWAKVDSAVNTTGLWQAEYFNNAGLSGEPILTQTENKIDYLWLGAPANGVPEDNFSIRWSANVPVEAGTYRFTVRADDGIRLKVDGQTIIDQWRTQPATTFSADVILPAGTVPVVVEYFDQTSQAVASLNWSKFSTSEARQVENTATSLSITDWKGEYFANTVLDGSPVVTRNDPSINFNWGSSSPIPNVLNHNGFSVRWSKTENIPVGSYLFKVYALDGARVWINGEQIINHWDTATGDWLTGTFNVTEGTTDIRVEYLHQSGMAEIFATWEALDGTVVTTTTNEAGETVETVITGPTATLISSARALTVRSGPGRDFGSIGYITQGVTVKLLGRDSETYWIRVELPDGTIGWSSGRFLSSETDFTTLDLQ